ncbi:MAG TPA: hypothetical protein PLI09_16520 [Candidatus Hydrogenedentes bacterium]|nr:hypothetical protein [Candidatus Hydrogenedentota bacterium]
METPLSKFRDEYLELVLRFLWREWSALGVAGQEQTPVRHVIDPEALLLFTSSLGRYDQRLFDEVLDWLTVNGRFLNVQRMKNIIRQEKLGEGRVVHAIADWLSRHENPMKWKLLAKTAFPEKEPSSLFFFPDGGPFPDSTEKDGIFLAHGLDRNPVVLRGYSQLFAADAMQCHILKLRALFGVNTRCDVLSYLTMNQTGHPREIAREIYYSQKAIHEVLTELACSGFLHSVKLGRERTFRISSNGMSLLTGGEKIAGWINWPVLLSIANMAWEKMEELRGAAVAPLLESAEIMLTMRPLLQRLMQSPWAPALPILGHQKGMQLLQALRYAFEALAA